MTAKRLILASTSSWRADLLGRLQIPFGQVDPEVDEAPYKERGLPPRELVVELAIAKAEAVARLHPGALVLGGDQVAFLDGQVLGKPGTEERARAQLSAMSGRTHELITGTALLDGRTGDVHTAVDVHRMTMRPLSAKQIHHYVSRERPLDAAGSYYIEGLGISLFERLQGDDFTAIIGLPLTQVVRLLTASGIDVLGPLG
ncbi:MAG: septum formation protein Maf [Deltaproteobacteria bacterium]|nr:septum formation protein Maf [Deltaproteobacteria bacterium]